MDVRSAINNSPLARQQPKPTYNCPTGNCTFRESCSFFAYCSSCKDISSGLTFTNYSSSLLNGWGKYTKISINAYYGDLTLSQMIESNATWVTDRTDLVVEGWNNVTMIRWDAGPEHESKAYSCSLVSWIRSYTANVIGGRLEERLIEEVRDSPRSPLKGLYIPFLWLIWTASITPSSSEAS